MKSVESTKQRVYHRFYEHITEDLFVSQLKGKNVVMFQATKELFSTYFGIAIFS
jgi:hypothetical protein